MFTKKRIIIFSICIVLSLVLVGYVIVKSSQRSCKIEDTNKNVEVESGEYNSTDITDVPSLTPTIGAVVSPSVESNKNNVNGIQIDENSGVEDTIEEEEIFVKVEDIEIDTREEYLKEESEQEQEDVTSKNPYLESYSQLDDNTISIEENDTNEITNASGISAEEQLKRNQMFYIDYKGANISANVVVVGVYKDSEANKILNSYNKNHEIQYLEYCENGFMNVVIDYNLAVVKEYKNLDLVPDIKAIDDSGKTIRYTKIGKLDKSSYSIICKVSKEVEYVTVVFGYGTEKEFKCEININRE